MAWKTQMDRLLVVVSLATGAITHGYNLFMYPLYVTDEGIYIQQAWSVLREARLSPYTYFYDHAPAGWLVIASWVAVLPSQFATFGNAIDTGRALMLAVHVVSTVLLDNLMVMWVLLTLYLITGGSDWRKGDLRIVSAILAGLTFGLAVLTKENAAFFA